MMSVLKLIILRLTLIVAVATVVLTSAHAASEADQDTMRVYASTMTNAIPTLARGEEEMKNDCGSISGPSGVDLCVHGIDFAAASVRTVRSHVSNLKVPDCLRDVDAKLRAALDLLNEGYSKTQRGLIAWKPPGAVMPVQDMDVMYSGMRDIEIADQKLDEATEVLKAALVACSAQ